MNVRVRNAKSQLVRMRTLDLQRKAELTQSVEAGEKEAAALRKKIDRGERLRLDERTARQRMERFGEVWAAMSLEHQVVFLRRLVERVGYDGRTGKVKVSFRSSAIKKYCTKGMPE